VLVGGAASLLNLIIHAVLLGAVVWTVRRLEVRDTFAPAFLQYTFMIVFSSISPSAITPGSAMAT
jgi:hypothetical protein